MGRYLGEPEQPIPSGAGAEATARGSKEGPWRPGSWSPREEDPQSARQEEGAQCSSEACVPAVGVGFM